MRTISEFVAKLQELIAGLPKSNVSTKNHLVDLESNICIYRFQVLLAQFKGSHVISDKKTLKPFIDFLSIRWSKILHSDANYMHHPHSPGNKYCIILGKLLAEVLHEEFYKLIMPELALFLCSSKGNVAALDLHEFVLGDDGVTPIEILPCLKAARMHPMSSFYHVCTDGRDAKPLTVNEGGRVLNHSANALSFYRKNNDKLIEDFKDPKNYAVTATYGKKGDERLASELIEDLVLEKELLSITLSQVKQFHPWNNLNCIIACIVDRATSSDCLFNFMRIRVAKRDWQSFLLEADEAFTSRNTTLLDFLLAGETDLLTRAKKNSIYKQGSHSYNRIVLFTFAHLYGESKAASQGQYTGTMKLFSNIVGGSVAKYVSETVDGYSYTNEEKAAAAQLFQAFLLSTHKLDDLDGFLHEHLVKSKDSNIIFETASRHVGALRQGVLGAIANQAKICCDPVFYQVVPESKGIFGLGVAGL